MMMTFSTPNVPDEECFETIKAGIDACPSGSLMMINSGEIVTGVGSIIEIQCIHRRILRRGSIDGKSRTVGQVLH